MQLITQNLPAGQILTVTADANSTGSVIRLPDAAGDTTTFASQAIAASASVALGPFSTTRRYQIQSDTGLLTYAVAAAAGQQLADVVTTISGDGAIAIATGTVKFTKGSAAAITLAAPRADQEGTTLNLVAGSAFAHVVTATGLLDDGVTGGSKTTATFAAFVGSAIILKAVGLKWSVIAKNLVTIT